MAGSAGGSVGGEEILCNVASYYFDIVNIDPSHSPALTWYFLLNRFSPNSALDHKLVLPIKMVTE